MWKKGCFGPSPRLTEFHEEEERSPICLEGPLLRFQIASEKTSAVSRNDSGAETSCLTALTLSLAVEKR